MPARCWRSWSRSSTTGCRWRATRSTPITLAAVVYTLLRHGGDLLRDVPATALVAGLVSSAIFSFLAIRLMLAMVRRIGFGVFAAYRVLLAVALFAWAARS